MVDDIQIAPNAPVENGNHILSVKRQNTVGNFNGYTSGITGVNITSPNPELSPEDTFNLNIISTPSNISTGPDLAASYISGLQIDSEMFTSARAGYQLHFDETATDSGKFQVTLKAADGTELSDPVILDNNIQTYKFYSKDTTSELGVSFNRNRM